MDRKTFLVGLIGISFIPYVFGTDREFQSLLINNTVMKKLINTKDDAGKFSFPELPYSYDALEPYIDKMTMEIHYSKHHKAYFDNFTKAIAGTELEKMQIEDIFKQTSKQSIAVRNNGGGFYNHILFWESMAPKAGGKPSGDLLKAIETKFGSFDEFKVKFGDAGKTRFGSGWAWLNVDDKGQLFISSTANQDNPMMDVVDQEGTPILALDVWEHAYYLKYQNKRADYVEAFWSVVDWKKIETRFIKLMTN